MLKKGKMLFTIFLSLLIFITFPLVSIANSAEPPSILIIVPNAPDNLEISLKHTYLDEGSTKSSKAFETYYTFYIYNLRNDEEYFLIVDKGDETFEVSIDKPPKHYNNIYTLDLKNKTLSPGKSLSRTILLVSLRVILTVIIEGFVFFIFGYRKKKSWIAFLIINLITQGFLNIWINGFVPYVSYIIIALFFLEILILLVEILAFNFLVLEHSRGRTIIYVTFANLLSFIAGGYLISILPI